MDVKLPDGTVVKNIPDNITKAELTAKLNANGYNLPTDNIPAQLKVEQPKSYSTMGAIGTGAMNLIPSTGRLLKGAYESVRHPIDTVNTLADLGAGGIYKALPQSFQEQLDKADVALVGQDKAQETKKRSLDLATALGQDYAKKYGSYEGFKRAFAEDPASILADASTVLTGGGAALKAGNLTKAADVVNQAAKVTNPLYLGAKAVQGVASVPSSLTKGTLGVTTGVGKAPIEEAIKAGEANVLSGTTTFAENMRNPARSDAVDIARQALDSIRQAKNQQYRGGMVDISKDKSILSFDDIDLAKLNTEGIGTYKGKVINERAANAMNEVKSAINEWKNADPTEFHTPEGMDKLKQKVGGILESLPYEQGTARTAVQNMYNSIKGTISKQAPTYSKVMSEYGEASDLIKEIEKSLSLGKKASADTAMRKLQSIMRNNVTSNYGQRVGAAEELINAGATELKPALAGQSMSAMLPRGLGGQIETYGGLLAALSNPSVLMAAPLASPRIMGEMLYKYGQTKGLGKKALNQVPLSVDQANKIGTLLYQMNQNKEQQ